MMSCCVFTVSHTSRGDKAKEMTFLKWSLMEAGKFAVLLSFPVMAVLVISDPYNIRRLIEARKYVVYPPSGEKPTIESKEAIQTFIRNREAANRQRELDEQQQQQAKE